MTIIEQIKAKIAELKKNNEISDDSENAQYEFDVSCGYDMACDDILSFIASLESEKPMNHLADSGKMMEQPVKDFPTTDKEMQHFFATHKPVQVPEKYKTADWIFKEQPVCEGFESEWKRYMESRKDDLSGHTATVNIKYVARHFAQWGAEHLKK